jgi:flavin-dependent dehydrogenase
METAFQAMGSAKAILSRIMQMAGALMVACTCGAAVIDTDVCVYGGTAAGAAAAVQAARMGKSVVLAEFGSHIGGLTSGGLGATDIGNKAAIGGISREFYHRVAEHYEKPEAWVHETREEFFKRHSKRTTIEEASGPEGTMWTFEPQVAEKILREMLGKIPVRFKQRLGSVRKENGRIREITMEDGTVYRARMFIDATYEGDLMAKAGVSYTVGRESNGKYGETLNGIRSSR